MLLHGGSVNFKYNYANFGWIKSLNESGLQVIGLDFRGHGQSGKPHDIESYGTANLASDVLAVLDHLALPQTSLVACSLGTMVALHLMKVASDRFDRAVLIATGDGLIGHPPHTLANILPAMIEVLDRTGYTHDLPKHHAAYWDFVVETTGDKQALRALVQASYEPLSTQEASEIMTPTLVVSGQNDKVLGRGPRRAQALGNGEYLEFSGLSHFLLAMDASVQAAVARFLKPNIGNLRQ